MHEAPRFILVACHRGTAASELIAEQRWNPDRFEVLVICASARKSYAVRRRAGTSTVYRTTGTGRGRVVLELREVARLWWPAGAEVDQRDEDARRFDRRAR